MTNADESKVTRPTADAGAVEPVACVSRGALANVGSGQKVYLYTPEDFHQEADDLIYDQSAIDTLRAQLEAARREVGEMHMTTNRHERYALEKSAQTLEWKSRAEAAEADAARYRWLRDSSACSLTVSHNDHHNIYQTVEQQFRNEDYYSDVPAAERQKMVETDTIWTVHIYPRTPVGFDVYHAATLDAAIDAAKAAAP